jgi:YbbR domain-containing protein
MQRSAGLSNTVSSVILALVLAVLSWIGAATNELVRVANFPRTGIPIQVVDVSDGLIVAQGPEQPVLVELLIPRDLERDLRATDLAASVDLSDLGPGEHQVPVRVVAQPGAPSLRLLDFEPDRVLIRLDEEITREFPVEVTVLGAATIPQNYRVMPATINPTAITVTGPRTEIEAIQSVVAEISIVGARETVSRLVRPTFLGPLGEIEPTGLRLSTERVEVTVPIEQRQGYRDLIVRPVLEGITELAERGYWVSGYSASPQLVTVVGQPPVVTAIEGVVATEPINVSDLSEGIHNQIVPLQFPEEVTPLQENFVNVTVRIEALTSSRTITLAPQVTGLEPGLVVTSIAPPSVDVLLHGPIAELEPLSAQQVTVSLDVTGREPGRHLIRPAVTAPPTLRAESIIPEQVEVLIEEQQGSTELSLPVTIAGAPETLYAVADPAAVTVTLQGPVRALDSLDASRVQSVVDVQGLPGGAHVVTPTFPFSNTLSVATWDPSTVNVRLYDRDSILVITAPVRTVNLAQNMNPTLSSQVAIVRATGPGTAAILSRDPAFGVILDLDGLGTGTHQLRPQVQLPPGYQLVSVVPQQIDVRLRR